MIWRFLPDMGWLRLVGCLKIYVSLQNIGLFCRALLQKRHIFLSILLIVATPYGYRISISSVTYTCVLISRLDDYKGGFIMCICVLLDLYDMEIFT